MAGIEPATTAWKAVVLPLNYIRKIMERKTRFELATLALARRCSTPEPLPHNLGRGRWIRTIECSANGFTVRPLWPLGNPSKSWSWWRESNPQPADYKSAALPLSHTSKCYILICKKLATENGLEPSTSSVTGWHSNQLNYSATHLLFSSDSFIIHNSEGFVKHYFHPF